MGYKKHAQTSGNLMIKYFNTDQKNYLKKLEIILNKRSAKQKLKSSIKD